MVCCLHAAQIHWTFTLTQIENGTQILPIWPSCSEYRTNLGFSCDFAHCHLLRFCQRCIAAFPRNSQIKSRWNGKKMNVSKQQQKKPKWQHAESETDKISFSLQQIYRNQSGLAKKLVSNKKTTTRMFCGCRTVSHHTESIIKYCGIHSTWN